MKTAFPKYNYEDMVDAHYRLVREGLGVKHLRLVIGNSMGGMHTWIWGGKYPQFMDALVPMASQPTEMAAQAMNAKTTDNAARNSFMLISPSAAALPGRLGATYHAMRRDPRGARRSGRMFF